MAGREFSRTDRAVSTVRKALAEPINALARNHGVALVTITEVEVSKDLRYGTVHLSVYGDEAPAGSVPGDGTWPGSGPAARAWADPAHAQRAGPEFRAR
jgi:hypothetical protein